MIQVRTSAGVASQALAPMGESIVSNVSGAVDAADLFARLAGNAKRPGLVLLESGERGPRYAERSIGVVQSALMVRGRGARVEIVALDDTGEQLLSSVRARLPRGVEATVEKDGQLEVWLPANGEPPASFEERLRSCAHPEILRAVLPEFHFEGAASPVPWGLYGVFSYDFVRHFETLPKTAADPLNEPDYVFFLPSRLFVVDHERGTTLFACMVPGAGDSNGAATRAMQEMLHAARLARPVAASRIQFGDLVSDTTFDKYCAAVEHIKLAIARGEVYQTVIGRMLSAPMEGNAMAAYRALRRCNPSPFLFYLRDDRGVLLGASPELAVRVAREGGRRMVELRPIAGTRPRGLRSGRIDAELDARLEISLKIDTKELAEHTMLVDLARNDVASVCRPGTTRVEAALQVEKYSHVQHLVSRIRGELREDFDALDAYVATMNMGTLTGAPKPQAMKWIAELESTTRGFFGGAVGFLTATSELETAIVIRAMRVLEGTIYLRAGAGIVFDSVAENEWLETERKMEACIQALREAGNGG